MGVNQRFETYTAQPLEARPSAPSVASKLLGLELLRFASALAVLFFHYRHLARIAGLPSVAIVSQPFYAILWPLYDYGQFGVQVFWAISGYIFFWKYGTAIHSRAVTAGQFFWLRFSRLYPLHLITLGAVVGLQSAHRQLVGSDFIYPAHEAGMLVRQLFLATDWASPPPMSFNGPIWSISAEVAIYGVFFLLASRFTPSRGLCIAVIVAGLVLQLAGIDWASIACATYFFAGALAALVPNGSERKAAIALAGLVLICLATGMLGDRSKLPMILLAAVPCLLVLLARDWSVLTRLQHPIQAAGNLTYSSYLLHFPLQLMLAIAVALSGIALPITASWFLLAYLGVTLGAAACSYRWFELPAQRWIRRRTLTSNA